MSKAVEILHEKYPGLNVDGEMQANFALNPELMEEQFPFCTLNNKEVNTLIFPNLSSGNITYKTIQEMMDVDAMGPVLVGMRKSVHILQLGASVREIINMVKVAVIDAQNK
jgi:malate dehydrogenase (oxaloacetate-decarboxylating)(NADP+)